MKMDLALITMCHETKANQIKPFYTYKLNMISKHELSLVFSPQLNDFTNFYQIPIILFTK